MGVSAATPPPYPCPGWSDGSAPPEGYTWQWTVAHDGWRAGGDDKRCRFTVGPRNESCKRPAVATLDRGRGPLAPNRWAYCEHHLYGRHLHDGAVWSPILTPNASGDSAP